MGVKGRVTVKDNSVYACRHVALPSAFFSFNVVFGAVLKCRWKPRLLLVASAPLASI